MRTADLLAALRRAGCDIFIDRDDGMLYCSPPARPVDWPDDPETAIEDFYDELMSLVRGERLTVH